MLAYTGREVLLFSLSRRRNSTAVGVLVSYQVSVDRLMCFEGLVAACKTCRPDSEAPDGYIETALKPKKVVMAEHFKFH